MNAFTTIDEPAPQQECDCPNGRAEHQPGCASLATKPVAQQEAYEALGVVWDAVPWDSTPNHDKATLTRRMEIVRDFIAQHADPTPAPSENAIARVFRELDFDQDTMEGVTAWLACEEQTVDVGGEYGPIESSAGYLHRLLAALIVASNPEPPQ